VSKRHLTYFPHFEGAWVQVTLSITIEECGISLYFAFVCLMLFLLGIFFVFYSSPNRWVVEQEETICVCMLLALCLLYVVFYILVATPSSLIPPPFRNFVPLMDEGVEKRDDIQRYVVSEHVEEEEHRSQ
jgi:hypothetical protein